MKSFRIGEFAKRHGISVQLLKNYDQQGILRPFMRDETGRYYLDSQSVELIEKQYLSGTGLSLQESRKLCDMGSLADWSAHLSQAHAFIENEIRERQTLLQFTHEIDRLIKDIQEKAPWRIEPWDGGKYIPQKESETYPWGRNGEPILQIWQRLSLPANSGGKARFEWGALVSPDFPLDVTPENMIPAGLCFVYAHSIPKERLLRALIEDGTMPWEAITIKLNIPSTAIRDLEKRGVVKVTQERRYRLTTDSLDTDDRRVELTAEQKQVLKEYHDTLFEAYCGLYPDQRQAVTKMKELWYYMRHLFEDRERELKEIKKAASPAQYREAARRMFA